MCSPVVTVREATPSDDRFLWECLATLRGGARYTTEQLSHFLRLHVGSSCSILIAEANNWPVGMITCNQFLMPRYIGIGVELEEVVIHPNHQGRGLARPMLKACVARYLADPTVRRITVHSDDRGRAMRLYTDLFTPANVQRYAIRGTPV